MADLREGAPLYKPNFLSLIWKGFFRNCELMERVGVPSYEKSWIRPCGVTLLWFVLMYFNWQLCYKISRQHWRNHLPEIKSTSFIWPFCSLPEKFAQELAPMHCGQRCCLVPFIWRHTFCNVIVDGTMLVNNLPDITLLHFVKVLFPVSTLHVGSSERHDLLD